MMASPVEGVGGKEGPGVEGWLIPAMPPRLRMLVVVVLSVMAVSGLWKDGLVREVRVEVEMSTTRWRAGLYTPSSA